MIDLFGFPMSNYHAIVKMCLLENGIEFTEHHDEIELAEDVFRAGTEVIKARHGNYLKKSPLGKVPCIGTPHGYLSETQIILDYLEETDGRVPLLPREPFARAKARELIRVIDLHVELVMRRVYPEAFFGVDVAAETKREVDELLAKGCAGVAALTDLSAYAMGRDFSQVDCVAAIHLPILWAVMRRIYGRDLTERLPNLFAYVARVGERPSYRAATETIRSSLTALGLWIGDKPVAA
jgi:glutathione S-transferase